MVKIFLISILLFISIAISIDAVEESLADDVSAEQQREIGIRYFLKIASMNTKYFQYWDRIVKKKPIDGIERIVDYELKKPSDEELMATLHESYTAFWLNLSYRACCLYFKLGANTPEGEPAENCKNLANYLEKYNLEFLAIKLYGLYPMEGNKDKKLNFGRMVKKLQSVQENMNKMNIIFRENTDSTLDILLQKLRNQFQENIGNLVWQNDISEEGQSIGEVEKNFHDQLWTQLLLCFGSDLLYIENYFASLIGITKRVTKLNDLVPNIDDNENFWRGLSAVKEDLGSSYPELWPSGDYYGENEENRSKFLEQTKIVLILELQFHACKLYVHAFDEYVQGLPQNLAAWNLIEVVDEEVDFDYVM